MLRLKTGKKMRFRLNTFANVIPGQKQFIKNLLNLHQLSQEQREKIQIENHMDDKRERGRKENNHSFPALAVGAGIGLLNAIYDIYKLISAGASLIDFLGTLCSLAAGVLMLFAVLALRKESKDVLPLFLSGLALGLFRWIIIDRAFQPTLVAFALLAIFAWFTWRIASWIQAKALT
jgi:hypothetical protein